MAYEPKLGKHLEPGTPEHQAAIDRLVSLAERQTAGSPAA